jgi:two-component system OmpR family response regulator
MRVLLIEDDREIARHIAQTLKGAGHVVEHTVDGRGGLTRALSEPYDVMILDRILPTMDGLAVLRAVRAASIATPVLMLTALDSIEDRVQGLEAGSDDYLVKPYSSAELRARVAALSRRPPLQGAPTRLQVGDLTLDLLSGRVARAGADVELKRREFQLLEFLMRHADQVVTRRMLLEGVWNFQFDPQTNIVACHMSHLRTKIHRGHPRELIQTVRGVGYMISDAQSGDQA